MGSKQFCGWVIDRAREKNTWRGFSLLLGAVGVNLSPELGAAAVTVINGVIGVVDVISKQK